MNALVGSLSIEKRVVEPLHAGLNLSSAVHDPPVIDVAVVVVQSDKTETWLNQSCVVSALSNGR